MADATSGAARWASLLATVAVVGLVVGPVLAHFRILPAMGGFVLFDLGGFLGLVSLILGIVAAVRGAGVGRGLILGGAVFVLFAVIAAPSGKFPRSTTSRRTSPNRRISFTPRSSPGTTAATWFIQSPSRRSFARRTRI